MGQILIGYDNLADSVALTAGDWEAADFLKDYRLSKMAANPNKDWAGTVLRINLFSPKPLGVLGLVNTNLTPAGQHRWKIYSDSGFTTLIYDSGVLDAYPLGTLPFGSIPWGAPNWWTATPLPAEVARFQRNAIHALPSPVYGQYIELSLNDPDNGDDLMAGRLFLGQAFRPTYDPAHGRFDLHLKARSEVSYSVDNTPYFNKRKPSFSIPFSLDYLIEDEAMRILDIQSIVDVTGEVLFMWDPDDPAYAYKRQLLGRLAELNPIEHPMYATYATAFQIEGQIP